MADTVTVNYAWVKPEVAGSPTTWGSKLNTNTDLIDAQVFANETAAAGNAAPIGSISMFAGATPPTNWLLCDGSVYQNSAIPALAPILNNQFNAGTAAVPGTSSAVPNFQLKLPMGAGAGFVLGATGGEAAHLLLAGEMPAHNHPVTDPQHYHGVAAYTHTHGVTDPTHAHSASENPHAHGTNLMRFVGSGSTFGVESAPGNVSAGNTDAAQAGVTVAANATGIQIQAAASGIPTTNNAATGISTQNVGSSASHNNLPPYVCVNFVIRYQ
jgi:microcystin-dependent protein